MTTSGVPNPPGTPDAPGAPNRSATANPLVVVISGPSGVGKSTIVEALRARHPEVEPIVAVTTRPRRPREIDGVHYQFVDQARFDEMRESGQLLEAADVHGHWYGTPLAQVRRVLAAGKDAILPIDPQGARTIRRLIPEAVLIFIMPPSLTDLLQRLRARDSESQASLAVRQQNAVAEMQAARDYDHVVVNETGRLAETAERIWEIIETESRRQPPRRANI